MLRRTGVAEYEDAMKIAHGGEKSGLKTVADVDIIGYFDSDVRGRKPLPSPILPGESVYRAPSLLIREVLGLDKKSDGALYVGLLANHDLRVYIDSNDLLSKHFAILAQTGSGKSFLAGVIVEELIDAGIATIILDSHGEYSTIGMPNTDDRDVARMARFGISPRGYLDKLQEFAVDVTLNPLAQPLRFDPANLHAEDIVSMSAIGESKKQVTILYRALQFFEEHDIKLSFRLLIDRVSKDKSVARIKVIDELKVLSKLALFEDPPTHLGDLVKPGVVSIINLRGVPLEIKLFVVYRLTKRLLELRMENRVPPVFCLIEECHTYAPENQKLISTKPIRDAVGEGRKFGLGVGVISQRSAKLDKGVLSQCVTQLILRMANVNDITAVASSIEGFVAGTAEKIPQLPVGHVIISSPTFPIPVTVEVRPRRSKHGGKTVSFTEPGLLDALGGRVPYK